MDTAEKDQFQDQLRKMTEEIFRLREQNNQLQAQLEMRLKQVASAFDDCFNRAEQCNKPSGIIERRY